jgi:hypothetical protein
VTISLYQYRQLEEARRQCALLPGKTGDRLVDLSLEYVDELLDAAAKELGPALMEDPPLIQVADPILIKSDTHWAIKEKGQRTQHLEHAHVFEAGDVGSWLRGLRNSTDIRLVERTEALERIDEDVDAIQKSLASIRECLGRLQRMRAIVEGLVV